MRTISLVAAIALLLTATSAAAEDEYQPPEFISATPEHPDQESGEVWELELADALALAAKNNLGLVLERESLRISELSVDVADGVFEPRVTGSYAHTNAKRLVESTTQGADLFTLKNHDWQIGLAKRFVTGTDISLGFGNDRTASTSLDAPSELLYNSVAQVRVSQPLLRGFSLDLDIPRIGVLRARLGSKRAREAARSRLMTVTQETETAYWGLVQALKSYEVQKASLALAEAQMILTKKQIRAGVLAPADEIEAESTLAQRELQLIQSKKSIDAASDRLRTVLNLPRDKWNRPVLPTESPTFEPRQVSAEDALKLAIKNRPEARQAKLDLKGAEYDVREANNNRLPQIDLDFSYSLSGQDQTYNDAVGQVGDRDAPAWTVLLSLTWTPLNRAAGASAGIARANRRIARAETDQAVLAIFAEVREAVRNRASAVKELAAASRFRSLAERSLDAEQRKFRSGASSNFLVAQRSQSLAQAQLSELNSLVALRVADIELERATGGLLESRSIKLE